MSAFVTDSPPSPARAMESKGSISSTRRRNCSVVNVPRCDRWKSLCFFLVSAGERNSIGGLHRDSSRGGCQPATARFSDNRTACKNCGADPRSAAGPLAGLPVVDETDPVGEERVQGGNLLLWHLLERWLCPRGRPTSFAEFSASELEKRRRLKPVSQATYSDVF